LEVDFVTLIKQNETIGYELSSQLFETRIKVNSDHSIIEVLDLSNNKTTIFERYLNSVGEFELRPQEDLTIQPYSVNSSAANCEAVMVACVSGCFIGTAAIALSDGPLPAMDILAASFYVTCNAGCALDFENCND